MNILISSGIVSLALILLADSIRQLRPHTKRKKRRPVKKSQPMPRVRSSVIDLTQTDLRKS